MSQSESDETGDENKKHELAPPAQHAASVVSKSQPASILSHLLLTQVDEPTKIVVPEKCIKIMQKSYGHIDMALLYDHPEWYAPFEEPETEQNVMYTVRFFGGVRCEMRCEM